MYRTHYCLRQLSMCMCVYVHMYACTHMYVLIHIDLYKCKRVCAVCVNFWIYFIACSGYNSRPSVSLNLQSENQPGCEYWLTLEWSVEYNIDFLEALDFFRITLTSEVNPFQFIQDKTILAHDTVCCITNTCIFMYILLFRTPLSNQLIQY